MDTSSVIHFTRSTCSVPTVIMVGRSATNTYYVSVDYPAAGDRDHACCAAEPTFPLIKFKFVAPEHAAFIAVIGCLINNSIKMDFGPSVSCAHRYGGIGQQDLARTVTIIKSALAGITYGRGYTVAKRPASKQKINLLDWQAILLTTAPSGTYTVHALTTAKSSAH